MVSSDIDYQIVITSPNYYPYMGFQPWENIELMLKSSVVLTYKRDLKVFIHSLWIESFFIKTNDNRYFQDRHHDIFIRNLESPRLIGCMHLSLRFSKFNATE